MISLGISVMFEGVGQLGNGPTLHMVSLLPSTMPPFLISLSSGLYQGLNTTLCLVLCILSLSKPSEGTVSPEFCPFHFPFNYLLRGCFSECSLQEISVFGRHIMHNLAVGSPLWRRHNWMKSYKDTDVDAVAAHPSVSAVFLWL